MFLSSYLYRRIDKVLQKVLQSEARPVDAYATVIMSAAMKPTTVG